MKTVGGALLICIFFLFCVKFTLCEVVPDCPVCLGFLKTIREYAIANKITSIQAFEKYCSIETLEVENLKFCYNTENIRGDIFRLLDLNAEEHRICKKIKSINPDFCQARIIGTTTATKVSEVNSSGSRRRGIIYE